MTTEQLAAESFALAVTALLFALYWLVVHRRMSRAIFRDALFRIRNRMFDRMEAAGKSFEDPDYVYMRDVVNGTIRFAEILHPVMIVFAMRKRLPNRLRPRSSDEGIAAIVDEALQAYQTRVGLYVMFSHISGWFGAFYLIVRAMLRRRRGWANAWKDNRPLNALQSEAATEARAHRHGEQDHPDINARHLQLTRVRIGF